MTQAGSPDTTRRTFVATTAALTVAAATGMPAGASPITAETEIQRLARERTRLKAIHTRIAADMDKIDAKVNELLPEKPRILVHSGLGRDELYTRVMWERSNRWGGYLTEAKRAEKKAEGDRYWDEVDRVQTAFHWEALGKKEDAAATAWLDVEADLLKSDITCAADAQIKLDIYKDIMDGEPEGLEGPFLAIAEQLIALLRMSAH